MAKEARKWFKKEWDNAQEVDENLLQNAQIRWREKQNARNAIMRCRIIAYENDNLSQEARDMFDQIAENYYNEEEMWFANAAAVHGGHQADYTCYENDENYLPN